MFDAMQLAHKHVPTGSRVIYYHLCWKSRYNKWKVCSVAVASAADAEIAHRTIHTTTLFPPKDSIKCAALFRLLVCQVAKVAMYEENVTHDLINHIVKFNESQSFFILNL